MLDTWLIASQLPVEHWHDYIGDSTIADAIMDRLIHNSYRITLEGESMHKQHSALNGNPNRETEAGDE